MQNGLDTIVRGVAKGHSVSARGFSQPAEKAVACPSCRLFNAHALASRQRAHVVRSLVARQP